MMKNRKTNVTTALPGLSLVVLGGLLSSCGDSGAGDEAPGAGGQAQGSGGEAPGAGGQTPMDETLAERVARCESFTGDNLADCPEGCELVESVRILYDGTTCEMATDDEGLILREDLCIAAEEESAHPFGYRGVYRRVEFGETDDGPVTPVDPEEVHRLYIFNEMWGWERCTETTSEYCACALQFEVLDG